MRHLRRTRRRPGVGEVLPPHRPQLRQLLSVPRAHRAAGRGPGGHRRQIQIDLQSEVVFVIPHSYWWGSSHIRGQVTPGGGPALFVFEDALRAFFIEQLSSIRHPPW